MIDERRSHWRQENLNEGHCLAQNFIVVLMASNPRECSRRVRQEYRDLLRYPIPGISVFQKEADRRHINVAIAGPEGSPYEGGVFQAELYLPKKYPLTPPIIRIRTPIYQ